MSTRSERAARFGLLLPLFVSALGTRAIPSSPFSFLPAPDSIPVAHLEEAVVSARRHSYSPNTAVGTLSETQVRAGLGNTLAATLEGVKGMSMVQTGATISKPVLHGMYGNRLLIVANGVRLQGQQWGAEHAPELDANSAAGIAVVKGAEAVRYGSDALGGVVLADAAPLPYARHTTQGSFSTLYGTNGRRLAFTGQADRGSSLFDGQAAWRLQATYVNGGDRSTARYLLNNTGLREIAAAATFGWKNSHWEIDAAYSLFATRLGVLFSAQMGEKDLLLERIRIGQPVDILPFSRSIDYPHQRVLHHTARLAATYRLPDRSTLRFLGSVQHNDRREFNLRRNYRSHVPTLDLRLTAAQFDLQWKKIHTRRWITEAGIFAAAHDNHNTPGTGVVPIIPNYTQQNFGVFALRKYTGNYFGAEAGVRFDHQRISALGIDLDGTQYGGTTRYNNFTYSLGAHVHPAEGWTVVTNFGTAWRAPHVHELYSNGLELASGLYAVGNADLRPEVSTKWVLSSRWKRGAFSLHTDIYAQWIARYIYDEPTREIRAMVSGFYPVFRYRSADAVFRGFDLEARWNFLARFAYEPGASMIWANERTTGRYLPHIPPFRFTQSLSWEAPQWGVLRQLRLKATHRFTARQTRFDPETDLISFAPPAYHLFGAEVGAALPLRGGSELHILLTADNLLNRQYRDYTNRFRYYAHDLGRDIRAMLTWKF